MLRPAWLVLPLAIGCGGPDTLHYRLRDPQQVTVSVDGQPALPPPGDPATAEPTRYDLRMRTGDDTLADVSFTLERDPTGVYGKWSTSLPLSHGEVFELVGNDGWIAELPTSAPARGWKDQVVFTMVPRLSYLYSRHRAGYATGFAGEPYAGEHVGAAISTPRSNLVIAEQRGDRTRIFLGIFALVPAAMYSGIGATLLTTQHNASGKAVGGIFAAGALTLDVTAIYEIVRGTRRRALHP